MLNHHSFLLVLGVDIDIKLAVTWYKLAAEQNHAPALFNLGNCYEHGIGVTPDLEKAEELYRKSSDMGNGNAMTNLGHFYECGIIVKEDKV